MSTVPPLTCTRKLSTSDGLPLVLICRARRKANTRRTDFNPSPSTRLVSELISVKVIDPTFS